MPTEESRPSLRRLVIYGFTSTAVLVERSIDDDLVIGLSTSSPSGARCESQGRESTARAQAARGRVCRGQSAAPVAEGQAGAGRRLSRRRVLDGAVAAPIRAAFALADQSRLQISCDAPALVRRPPRSSVILQASANEAGAEAAIRLPDVIVAADAANSPRPGAAGATLCWRTGRGL